MVRIFLNFDPIWLCFIFSGNIFTEIYISTPHHIAEDIIIINTVISESSMPLITCFPLNYKTNKKLSLIFLTLTNKAPGFLISSFFYQHLFASNLLTLPLSALSPKWASSGVIVGTCKCPVAAPRVENTVIGLGLCETKRTVRLQLILSHPVSSCV